MGAAFVTILVLQLNRPPAARRGWTLLTLYGRLALFYAPHLTVGLLRACWLLAWSWLGRADVGPSWVSLRVLSWGRGSWSFSAAAALMWAELLPGSAVVARRRFPGRSAGGRGRGDDVVCAPADEWWTVVHYRSAGAAAASETTLLVLTLAASVLFPMAARGWGEPTTAAPTRSLDLSAEPAVLDGPRVTLVAVDGASLDYIAQACPTGGCRTSGGMLEGGASMHLAIVRPTQPAPVWTTVATGKYRSRPASAPPRPYVRRRSRADRAAARSCFSHALVHLGILESRPVESDRRPRASPVGDSRRQQTLVGRRQLAGDSAGATGARVSHHRPLLPQRRSGRGQDDAGLRLAARRQCCGRAPLSRAARRAGRHPRPVRRGRRRLAPRNRRCNCATSTGRGCSRCGTKASTAPATCSCLARPRDLAGFRRRNAARLRRVLDRHYAFLDAEIARTAGDARPGGSAAGGVGLRDGAGQLRQAHAGASAAISPTSRARTKARPTASCSPTAPASAPAAYDSAAGRHRHRRSCTSSGCRWRATWTATPAPTSSPHVHRSRPITYIPTYNGALQRTEIQNCRKQNTKERRGRPTDRTRGAGPTACQIGTGPYRCEKARRRARGDGPPGDSGRRGARGHSAPLSSMVTSRAAASHA